MYLSYGVPHFYNSLNQKYVTTTLKQNGMAHRNVTTALEVDDWPVKTRNVAKKRCRTLRKEVATSSVLNWQEIVIK